MRKMKGFRSTFGSYKIVQGCKYGTGNIVNRFVITMYGARWAPKMLEGLLCKVYDCLTTMLYS